MNLPSLKSVLPTLTLLLIALELALLPRFDALFFASARYERCSRLAVSAPGKALALAHAWRASHPASPLGQHCEALALFAAKDYSQAAEAFIALAKTTTHAPPLAARLFTQGARAYEAAGRLEEAKQAAAAALMLAPDDAQAKDELAEITKKTPAPPPAPALPKK